MTIKSKLLAFASLFIPSLMLAQESSGPTIDTAQVTAVGNAVQSAVTTASTTLTPILTAIIVAGLSLWLVVSLPGILKRAWGAGKGR